MTARIATHPGSIARTLQATLAAVTAAAIALVLAPTPASALTAEALEYQENLTWVDTPVFSAVDPAVPLVDSTLGRGTQLAAGANTVPLPVPDAEPAETATGVLARITLLQPAADTTVSIAAAEGAHSPLLFGRAGATVSTTTLLPLSEGGVTLHADAASHVRLEPLAYLRGDARAPGSTTALPEAARRADTEQGLGGSALAREPLWFGLTGQGGVPSELVRSVYVSFDVTLATPNTLVLADGQRIPLSAGRSVFTTIVTPDEHGGVEASLADAGTGQLVADVTGWVAEAAAHSTAVNRVGSYVSATEVEELRAEVAARAPATGLALSDHDDVAYALALVDGSPSTPATQPTTTLQWSAEPHGRAQGVAVDGAQGVAPQLAFVPLEAGEASLSIRQGAAAVAIHPLGGFLGEPRHAANPDASIEIVSPSAGSEIDISGTGYFTIEGTAFSDASAVDRIELSAPGHGFIGTAGLVYEGDQLSWYFDAGAPEDGEFTFVATLFDRGAPNTPRDTAQITVQVDTPEADEEVVAPNVRHFNQAATEFTISTEDPRQVRFAVDPEVLPGDLVVSGATAATPAGFLGAVVSINVVNGVWIVDTREPNIDELVFQADIDETIDYENGEGVQITHAAESAASPAELYEIDSAFPEGVPADILEPVTPEIVIDEASHVSNAEYVDLVAGPENVDLTFDEDNVPAGYEGTVDFACVDLAGSEQEPQGDAIDEEGRWVAPADPVAAGNDCNRLRGVTIDKSWSLKTEAKFLFQLKNGKLDLEDQTRKTPEEIAAAARGAFDKKIGMSIQVESELLPHLLFKLDVKLKKKLGFIPTHVSVNEFKVEQKNYIRAQGSVAFFIALEWKFNVAKRLANIQLPTVTFMVGPAPIVITNKLEIGVSINAGLKGQVTLPLFGASRTDNFGFTYASGRSLERIRNTGEVQYSEPAPEPLQTGGKAELGGWLTAGPSLEFASQIYGFAGPALEFKAGPGIEGNIVHTGGISTLDLTVFLGLELSGGAKLTILRWNLLNVKVFELKWKVVLFHREKVLG